MTAEDVGTIAVPEAANTAAPCRAVPPPPPPLPTFSSRLQTSSTLSERSIYADAIFSVSVLTLSLGRFTSKAVVRRWPCFYLSAAQWEAEILLCSLGGVRHEIPENEQQSPKRWINLLFIDTYETASRKERIGPTSDFREFRHFIRRPDLFSAQV